MVINYPSVLGSNGAVGVDETAHNCFTWARKTLRAAKIFLYEEPPSKVNTKVITLPKSCISLQSIYSKEKIAVQLEGTDSKFDMTPVFSKIVRFNSWRLPTDLQGNPTQIPIVRGRIDLSNHEDPVKELDRVEILIVDQNGQDRQINITEAVRERLKAESFRTMPLSARKVDKFVLDHKLNEEELKSIDRDDRRYSNKLTGQIMLGAVLAFSGGAPVAVLYVATGVATAIEIRSVFSKK